MSMVWEHYPAGGGDLLMALACADHAHERQLRERRDPGPDEGNPAMREAARAKIAELTHQMRLTRPDRGKGA